MARVVVLGAGISGHTAAMILRRKLPKDHEVIVVSPNRRWNWIPSNIWVGVGLMDKADVTFELRPVYDRVGIVFKQARGIEIHPDGRGGATARDRLGWPLDQGHAALPVPVQGQGKAVVVADSRVNATRVLTDGRRP